MSSNPIPLSLHAGSPPQSLVAPNEDTAIHQLVNDALSKNYSSICVPLANDAWKERWMLMCLKSSSSAPDAHSMAAKLQTEEVEKWRAGGCFLRGEVNLSRIGEVLKSRFFNPMNSPDARIRYDSKVVLDTPPAAKSRPCYGLRARCECMSEKHWPEPIHATVGADTDIRAFRSGRTS